MKTYKVIYDPSTLIGSFEIEADSLIVHKDCSKLIRGNECDYEVIASIPLSCVVFEVTETVKEGIDSSALQNLEVQKKKLEDFHEVMKTMLDTLKSIESFR